MNCNLAFLSIRNICVYVSTVHCELSLAYQWSFYLCACPQIYLFHPNSKLENFFKQFKMPIMSLLWQIPVIGRLLLWLRYTGPFCIWCVHSSVSFWVTLAHCPESLYCWQLQSDFWLVGAVQCCIVCHGCTQLWAHTHGQFLQMFCAALGLDISFWVFCVFLG